jgi:uncharacterized protein YndB with AHSA1/START domain
MREMKLTLALLLTIPLSAVADVADAAANGFTIKFSWDIKAAPADLYQRLVTISDWWQSDHTYSGNAKNLSIDLKPGGCFCEKTPKGGVQHMVVVRYDTGKTLVMQGGLGPLQSAAAAANMTVEIAPAEGGSKLNFMYAVTGYAPGGLTRWAPTIDSVLKMQLTRLKSIAETGKADTKP